VGAEGSVAVLPQKESIDRIIRRYEFKSPGLVMKELALSE
jgi:hypothetical protein